MSESLADRFIACMATINQIEYRQDDPMRYAACSMRDLAQGILSDAISKASYADHLALQMQKDYADAMLAEREKGDDNE